MCVGHVCLGACIEVREQCVELVFPSTMWVLDTELRSSSLLVYAVTCWATLMALNMI